MKKIQITADDAVLKGLIIEQIARLKTVKISDEKPDLIIARAKTTQDVPHLLLGGPSKNEMDANSEVLPLPLRLGDLTDRVMYILSGRERFAGTDVIEFRSFTLNSLDGVMKDTEKNISVRLTDKEKLLIVSLFNAPSQALDRAALLHQVWSYSELAETHTLETHLYRLRQKLEENFGVTDLIVTKDGIYTLAV